MSEITFTFAGFNSKEHLNLVVRNIKREIISLSEQMTTIPNRMGAIYEGSAIGSKVFEVEVLLKADSEEEKAIRFKDIATITQATNEDALEYELQFDDEPNIVYWSHITSVSTPDRVQERSHDTLFTIVFTCSEGVGYGEKVLTEFDTPTIELNPMGTANTYPVFSLQVTETITKAGIATDSAYVYVGEEDETSSAATSTRVLSDRCNTMATWTKITTPTWVIENGVIASDADIVSTGESLRVTKKDSRYYYGSSKDTTQWKGACRYQGLPRSLTDWQITARFYVQNKYPRSRTKMELYLLNSIGVRIGKLMIKDIGVDLQNLVQAEIGTASTNKDVFLSSRDASKITKKKKAVTKKITISSKYTSTVKGKKGHKKGDTYSKSISVKEDGTENLFTDFYGSITLKKVKNKYTATVQKLTKSGVATGKAYTKTFTDSSGKYSTIANDLAGVALYMAEMPIKEDTGTTAAKYAQNYMSFGDIKVWDKSGTTESDVIAEDGDELIFDFDNAEVLRNGERIPFAIGSEFFKLTPNEANGIGVTPAPSDKFLWDVSYIPRYL